MALVATSYQQTVTRKVVIVVRNAASHSTSDKRLDILDGYGGTNGSTVPH